MAFGVTIDFDEVMRLLRSVKLSRGRKETEVDWVGRLVGVIRKVWDEARFLSPDEWRRSDERSPTWDWVDRVPEALIIPRAENEPVTPWVETQSPGRPGEPLPVPQNGWQSGLPDEQKIRVWIEALAPRYVGASRRKLLAARIVAWRWRLSADAVLSKLLAQRRTNW